MYKQTNSTFYSSNELCLENNVSWKKIQAVTFLYEFVETYTSHICESIRNSYLVCFEKLRLGNYGNIV